jgi:transposase
MDRETLLANPDAFIEQHLSLIQTVKDLMQLCQEQRETIAKLELRIQEQDKQISGLVLELKTVKAAAARYRFGRKSERDIEGQLALPFDSELESAIAVKITADATEQIEESSSKKPKKKRGGRTAIPEHLPREQRVYKIEKADLDEEFGVDQWREIGEETRLELDYRPGKLVVIEHVTKRYAGKDRSLAPIRADSPKAVIAKGRPSAGLLAHIVIAKYSDHLPLYRIDKIFKRDGISIPKSTVCHWVQQTALLLTGIVNAIKNEILSGDIIRSDATHVVMLDKNSENGSKRSYIFPYMNHSGLVVFDHSETHNKQTAKKFIGDFKGYFQADAAGIYDSLYSEDTKEVACWAHARRKFDEAKNYFPKDSKTALKLIRGLYEIERQAKNEKLSIEEIRRLRQEKAKPLLISIRQWMKDRKIAVLPSSAIGKALSYSLKNFDALETYIEDGRLKIDNNDVEGAIRPVALGRKNFLFFAGQQGGRAAAIHYTIIANCRLEGINPFEYIKDVLSRIPGLKAQDALSLTPRNWKATQASLTLQAT